MNCSEVAANIQLLVDEELPQEMIAEIRLHIQDCQCCVEKFEAERLFKQVLREKICKNCVPQDLVDGVRSTVLHHEYL